MAEYFHHLPGCEHCYEKNFSTFIRDKCIEGGLNNDVDIFVPEYPEKLTHYYNTGVKKIDRSTVFDRFDRALLESSIFSKLYRRYGIRHKDIVDTNISLSRRLVTKILKQIPYALIVRFIILMQPKGQWTMDVSRFIIL